MNVTASIVTTSWKRPARHSPTRRAVQHEQATPLWYVDLGQGATRFCGLFLKLSVRLTDRSHPLLVAARTSRNQSQGFLI
jgi:hypothetical protein